MSARPMRVAFCENGAGYGGAIISLAAFLEKIPASFDPFLYTALGSPQYRALSGLATWRHTPPVSVISERWLMRRLLPFASTADNLFNLLPSALSYYRTFRRDAIDLVYLNNDASSNMAAALGAQLARLPMIMHARGFNTDTRGGRWLFGKVDYCIAVSTAVRDNVLQLGLAPDKCIVVAEGLDLTQFRPQAPDAALLAELGIKPGQPVITLVGGLVDWKGQDVLVEAAPRIFEQFPEAHILLVGGAYGKDPQYAETIAVSANAPELRGRVRLLGARDDIAALLAVSNIVVHASTRSEPFGRTFLEGMALARPVIASNEGGPLDVIEHGVDGLLIRPRDPAELARNVIRLLADPEFAGTIGTNAAVKAREYSIERHTDAICSLLRAVGSSTPRLVQPSGQSTQD